MKQSSFFKFNLFILLSLLLSLVAQPGIAQINISSNPIVPINPGIRAENRLNVQRDPDGLWYMPAENGEAIETNSFSPQTTGGPDDFGYTWDDTIPLSWINASGGTDTGINSNVDDTSAIDIGFNFKFYENTFSKLYITRYGYITFDHESWPDTQSELPDAAHPNNVIAPDWKPIDQVNGYVHYLTGGTAPDRYFVIEWNHVGNTSSNGSEDLTFELILKENGDIVFQYQNMTSTGNRYCEISGIEDSRGLDASVVTPFCRGVNSNHAVRIARPAPAARLYVSPRFQGSFTSANSLNAFLIKVTNTGELGTDIYDLSTSSTWTINVYADDGVTPLTDTDTDGVIDTGSTAQGSTTEIVAKVQAPPGATLGSFDTSLVTVCSSVNPTKCKTANIKNAVPAPFIQAFNNNGQVWEKSGVSLYFIQPVAQQTKRPSEATEWGYDVAVAEAPNGNFVNAWAFSDCDLEVCYENIKYSIVNKYGEIVRQPTLLTQNKGADFEPNDYSTSIAIAADGKIGLLWIRGQYQKTDKSYLYNYNLYFAILSPVGDLIYGPENLTNNSDWGEWYAENMKMFGRPQITATSDNRFGLAWYQYGRISNCTKNDCYLNDIYYSIRSTSGSVVKGITQHTNDTANSDVYEAYSSPGLTTINGNQIFLVWSRSSDDDLYYSVLDSAGNAIRNKALLANGPSSDFSADAVQLSDGKILVAYEAWENGDYIIQFATLDSSFNLVGSPVKLNNAANSSQNGFVSVTADKAGHAILTWFDNGYNQNNLYYALVNSTGEILTPPMIYAMGDDSEYAYIGSSNIGYGNSTYSSAFDADIDTAVRSTNAHAKGSAGGSVPYKIAYSNHGQTIAPGVVLTCTLSAGLTFLGDTSGITPTVKNNTIVWDLPDLSFLMEGKFLTFIGIPKEATLGTKYPVTYTLATSGTESNPGDNILNGDITVSNFVYLPVINK